jgi:carboxypeptidase C (cathepsin A)
MLYSLLAAFAVSVGLTAATQVPLALTPLHLSSLGSDEFTSLSHPRFPNHRVRVKQSNFCDPTVNVYTGYLDVDQGAKHLFFYFFESRRDPATGTRAASDPLCTALTTAIADDVLMWINGGPGCSSAMGLLMELGMSRSFPAPSLPTEMQGRAAST